MRFRRPNGGLIEFSAAAIATLVAYRQSDGSALEAGGVLLGRHILETDDVVVDRVSEPSETDRRSRFWFRRARKPAQKLVNLIWEESKGVVNYLGEWHTHPENDPSPSWIDRCGWKKSAKRVKAESEQLFFIIVGTKLIRAWEVNRWDLEVRMLEIDAGS